MNIPETIAPLSCSDEDDNPPPPPPPRTKASSKSYRTTPTNNVTDKKSLPHTNTTSGRKQSRKRKRELPTMPASSEDSDDSDHTPPPSKKGLRSASASPRKAAAASQATPSPRKASSGHSTPSRRTPNSRHKHTPKSNLSESEDETDSPPLLPEKTDNNQKTKALMAMFGKKAAKGKGAGKGKGGKGKGGINFIVGETDDEESRRDKQKQQQQHHSNNTSATQHNIPPQTIKQEAPDSPAIHSPKHMSPAARGGGPRRGSAGTTVDQDLALSDEDDESCRQQQQQSAVCRQSPPIWRQDGRPSLVCSIPLSRVSRSFGDPRISSQSQKEPKGSRSRFSCDTYSENTLKCNNKVDRPLSHSERISAEASSRLEAASRDLPERPASARTIDSLSRDRRSSGGSLSWRNGSGGGSDHRKAQERTISQEKRQSSPGGYYEWEKRARLQEQDYHDESQSAADAVVVHHHPTSYMNGEGLMPPPRINGYVGGDARRIDDEVEIEEIQDDARKLKREADSEENMEIKCTKYLKAILLFCQSAMRSENDKELGNAVDIYKQTIKMIKCILKPFIPKRQAWPPKEQTDIRLLVMSLRAQSLLNLKMYKLNRHSLKDLQKQINEVLTKSNNGEENAQGGEHGHLSPTPSPAGSEGSNCSKSSGYTSSGERERPGLVSITKSTLENQFNIAAYLSQCHELWEQAELFLNKGNCEDFFRRLDEECGALTLHSDLSKLTKYTKTGLDTISQEYSSMHRSPLTQQHRNS